MSEHKYEHCWYHSGKDCYNAKNDKRQCKFLESCPHWKESPEHLNKRLKHDGNNQSTGT